MRSRWLLLGLVGLLSCDGNELGTADSEGHGDEDSAACDDGQIEDGLGECRTSCENQDDCPDGEACQLTVGLCLPTEDVTCDPDSCEAGTVCPPDGGVDCVPVEDGLCEVDEDCPFGFSCDNNKCSSLAGEVVLTCSDAEGEGCPILMTCQFGVCVGCLDDLQCEGGTCVLGTCIVADLGPAGECLTLECPDGSRCDPLTGVCEPTCAVNEDCDESQICAPVLNQCIVDFSCAAPEDCLTGSCELGLCTGCTPDGTDCQPGTFCLDGGLGTVCLPTLDGNGGACADVTCDPDNLCDPLDGSCYPADGTCGGDEDCREGHDCNFLGLCSGCSVDGDCRPDQRCLFGTCVLPP